MKCAIFDFDGTLFDSLTAWKDLDVEYLKRYDIVPSTDIRQKIYTLSLHESATLFKNTYNLKDEVSKIVEDFYQIVGERYKTLIIPKEGVIEFLQELKDNNIKMCVATLSSKKNVENALNHFSALKYFEFIVGSEDINVSKTNPDMFRYCANKLNVEPSKIYVFEDSLFAMKTAKNEGFKVVGVYDEHSKDDIKEVKNICDFYIESFVNNNLINNILY